MTTIDGLHFDELMTDLDREVEQLIAVGQSEPSRWTRGKTGKWRAGQHAEHVTKAMELMLTRFDDHSKRLAAGTLGPQPRRGFWEGLFVRVVLRPGWMPRGGPAIPPTYPSDAPDPADVARRLREAVGGFRAVGMPLDPATRDRLWIQNPNMTKMRWYYSLPEAVRIHAIHVRHHATLMDEAARA